MNFDILIRYLPNELLQLLFIFERPSS